MNKLRQPQCHTFATDHQQLSSLYIATSTYFIDSPLLKVFDATFLLSKAVEDGRSEGQVREE